MRGGRGERGTFEVGVLLRGCDSGSVRGGGAGGDRGRGGGEGDRGRQTVTAHAPRGGLGGGVAQLQSTPRARRGGSEGGGGGALEGGGRRGRRGARRRVEDAACLRLAPLEHAHWRLGA